MAADLLSALHEGYAASAGVEGLNSVWTGAASDTAVQPYAVLRVYSSRREIQTPEVDGFATLILAETYADTAEAAIALGDALADLILAMQPTWDGGAGTRPIRDGDPVCERDFRRARKGQELWFQRRRFLVHAIEGRTP